MSEVHKHLVAGIDCARRIALSFNGNVDEATSALYDFRDEVTALVDKVITQDWSGIEGDLQASKEPEYDPKMDDVWEATFFGCNHIPEAEDFAHHIRRFPIRAIKVPDLEDSRVELHLFRELSMTESLDLANAITPDSYELDGQVLTIEWL